MERELWRWMSGGLKRLPRWWPRGAVYDNRQVLAVLLWAALSDRSITWACRRDSRPPQAWRRVLPDQSTMSRRLRDPRVMSDLLTLLSIVQRRLGSPTRRLMMDGKPLPVSIFTGDPDATLGWGAGRHQMGYKLHALIDSAQRLLAWELRPMNDAECTVAADLLRQARDRGTLPEGATALGDASYDSNPLHAAAASVKTRLIAPRRRPDLGLCGNRTHHPGRVESIKATEGCAERAAELRRERATIERYFGTLSGSGAGLNALPAWVRRLGRVRVWVGAKLIVNAARHVQRRSLAA